jgi:DNA-directed RNA polymerase subunit RPC12/RpoP
VSEIKTFFRFCPACGRRFHIKLVSKELVNLQRESVEVKRAIPLSRPQSGYSGGMWFPQPVVVLESEPTTIDVEEFQYAYKCGSCGHEWSEKHFEDQKEG